MTVIATTEESIISSKNIKKPSTLHKNKLPIQKDNSGIDLLKYISLGDFEKVNEIISNQIDSDKQNYNTEIKINLDSLNSNLQSLIKIHSSFIAQLKAVNTLVKLKDGKDYAIRGFENVTFDITEDNSKLLKLITGSIEDYFSSSEDESEINELKAYFFPEEGNILPHKGEDRQDKSSTQDSILGDEGNSGDIPVDDIHGGDEHPFDLSTINNSAIENEPINEDIEEDNTQNIKNNLDNLSLPSSSSSEIIEESDSFDTGPISAESSPSLGLINEDESSNEHSLTNEDESQINIHDSMQLTENEKIHEHFKSFSNSTFFSEEDDEEDSNSDNDNKSSENVVIEDSEDIEKLGKFKFEID